MRPGFGKFLEFENESYDKEKRVSIQNFTTVVNKESIAYKFHLALEELKKEGFVNELYDKYYKWESNSF